MFEIQESGIYEWPGIIRKVNQKIISNYLRNYSGYHHDIRDITHSYSDFILKLFADPSEMAGLYFLYQDFFKKQQELWLQQFVYREQGSVIEPEKDDKRFNDPAWTENPWFNFIKQNYLLAVKLSAQIIEQVEMDEKTKKKLAFYTHQYMSAFSPSNFLLSNPEALSLAWQTQGESVWKGMNNFIHDLEKGRITQTDESFFEVGRNLAISPGNVVYENELMQLIQYPPVTKEVYEMPVLLIPPWINKYYVLDLQPKNSFVSFLVKQGFTVFAISWNSPEPGSGPRSFDDYVEKGALKAIRIAKEISGSSKINACGYCLGGTLLSVACAILCSQASENPVNSATLLASMVDFSDPGPLGDVIDGALIRKLERGELLRQGILNGHDMETAFNLIRPNDLVWKYVVNNYLKGLTPPASDVLYWTNDNTNLPADMYIFYMRRMLLENKLSRKNALTICNEPIDISKINIPVFSIGFKEDTISPPHTVFTTTELVSGPVEFILGESGHVMGVVNPPSRIKYGHYTGGTLGKGFDEWQNTAKRHEESWWLYWSKRLSGMSGGKINAVATPGNEKYKPIEAAPGKFARKHC
ncbi:MAG: PHA/PHB synthase family protein [Bacteroidia bacterium]